MISESIESWTTASFRKRSTQLYDVQDLYDLLDFGIIWRICKIWNLHTFLQHVQPGWGLYEIPGRYFTGLYLIGIGVIVHFYLVGPV